MGNAVMERIVKIKKYQHDCPVCDKIHEVEEITRIIASTIKDSVVEHEETILRCPQTGDEWYHGKMLDDTLLCMRNAYREKNNLLTSGEIINIRKKYKLSQKELSNLLGWGNVTISRYETKLIQDETYDSILRIAANSPSFVLEKLNINKKHFSEKRFIEIKSLLKKMIKETAAIDALVKKF